MGAIAALPVDLLRQKAEEVRRLLAPLRVEAGAVAVGDELPGERHRRAYAALEDAVLDLSIALPQGTEDFDARKLFEFLVGLRRAIDRDPDGDDRGGEVELHAAMMGDVLHRIERRLLHDELDRPDAAAAFIFATLAQVTASDVARLLGVSAKTVGVWRAGGPVARNGDRVVVVAQLVSYLRQSLTPLGIVMWFDAERDLLNGATPLELLDRSVASAREPLIGLARGMRGQLAG